MGGAVPLPAAALGRLAAVAGRPRAASGRRRPGRRPVLHPQRFRADLELPGPDGADLVRSGDAALSVVAAVPGVAGIPRHDAPGRAVDHRHPARRGRSLAGCREADRDQLCPAVLHGAAVVRTVLRRHQLGRPGLVDQRGVVGLPALRRAGRGDLPDRRRLAGPEPVRAGRRGGAAAHPSAARQRGALHTVELAAEDPRAVHRRGAGLRGGATTADRRPRPPDRRLSVGAAGRRPDRRPLPLRRTPGAGHGRLRRAGVGAVPSAGGHARPGGRLATGAAVHPGFQLRREDFVQSLHDSRTGAHRLELGGGPIPDRDAEVGGQSGGGRAHRGGRASRDAALPRRRGTGPPLDAADDRHRRCAPDPRNPRGGGCGGAGGRGSPARCGGGGHGDRRAGRSAGRHRHPRRPGSGGQRDRHHRGFVHRRSRRGR